MRQRWRSLTGCSVAHIMQIRTLSIREYYSDGRCGTALEMGDARAPHVHRGAPLLGRTRQSCRFDCAIRHPDGTGLKGPDAVPGARAGKYHLRQEAEDVSRIRPIRTATVEIERGPDDRPLDAGRRVDRDRP